jgi:tRNA nucleotidyltransferase (CCA-adding enzyme)
MDPDVRLQAQLGELWPAADALMAAATARGVSAHLVGGCVRDLLLRRAIRDLDVVVEGSAIELAAALARAHGGQVRTAAAFGTASWTPPPAWAPCRVDLAMARHETYAAPAALPQVRPAGLRDDLARRDFSVHAMSLCWNGAGVHWQDPFEGRADLQARCLRILHPQSFVDDPTRLLRAARFAGRLGFELAPATAGCMEQALQAGLLQRLSADRRGAELNLIFAEPEPEAGLGRLHAWGLDGALFGGKRLNAAAQQGMAALARLPAAVAASAEGAGDLPSGPQRLWLGLALWLADAEVLAGLGQHGVRQAKRLPALQPALERARAALVAADPLACDTALSGLPIDGLLWLMSQSLDAAAQARLLAFFTEGRHRHSQVDGALLQAQGLVPGPAFTPALAAAQQAARRGADAAAQVAAALDAFEKAGGLHVVG